MNINPEEYIVVVISSVKNAEGSLLGNLGRNNNMRQPWCYAAYGFNVKILSKPNGNQADADNYKFFIINPDCLRQEDNHNACRNKINSLFTSIKQKNKIIICWLHNTDNIMDVERVALGNSIDCKPFSHADTVEHADKNGPVHFMFTVGKNNFAGKFKTLIEYSLKKNPKPHLIALSILCQGYLAAHGKKAILSGWEDVWNKLSDDLKDVEFQLKTKSKTEEKGWWQPAFGKKDGEKEIKQSDDFSQTIIFDEISSIGKTCGDSSAIENLFKEIKGLNGQSFCDTDKVIRAYNCIKELL